MPRLLRIAFNVRREPLPLDGLSGAVEPPCQWQPRDGFDLQRYQSHLQAQIGPIALPLDEIPPLNEDARLDRIWRFIAIIFMAHAGLIHAWQDGQTIMVIKRETDTEGQDISRDIEDTDGREGPLGGVEA